MQNLSLSQCMKNQSQAHVFVFWIKAFSDLIIKTVVSKIAWYQEVYQIITHQPRYTNLHFLQDHLESNIRLCFWNLEWKEKTYVTRKVFWKISFFHFQPGKALIVLRYLKLQSFLAKKNLVNYYMCAWFNDNGVSLAHFL